MVARASAPVSIGGRGVGHRHPVFVIAEAGVNHDGELDVALELVDAAVEAGADAVKFQTFEPSAVASSGAALAPYQHRQLAGESDSQLRMLERLYLSLEDFRAIARHCEGRGIAFLSTPFDLASAVALVELGVPALKVGSGELTNLPFIAELAALGRPLILSTGMATLAEVGEALRAASGNREIVLLHCVSSYPTPLAEANVRAIDTLRETFDVPVGYSDHCLQDDASLAAVARGACVLERHLTLDRTRRGPDHSMSLEPARMRALIEGVRRCEAVLGNGLKQPQQSEHEVRALARRSVVATRALRAGETLTANALTVKRPGGGLAPARLPELIGARLARPLAEDELLTEAHIEGRA